MNMWLSQCNGFEHVLEPGDGHIGLKHVVRKKLWAESVWKWLIIIYMYKILIKTGKSFFSLLQCDLFFLEQLFNDCKFDVRTWRGNIIIINSVAAVNL
jgi:hypothetical protein